MINIQLEGNLLLTGRDEFNFRIDLYETDSEQYIYVYGQESVEHSRVVVACTYDFDYRGMVELLNEDVDTVTWCAFDMLEILEDWVAVDCDCDRLDEKVSDWFRHLGESA